MNAPNSPAFPCPGAEGVNPESLGMSLRVYAAIEAMKALVITLRPEVDEMGRILPSQWRPIVSGSYKLADEMIREGVAALTPAPTQEPPTGGVTISTEKKGGDEPCATNKTTESASIHTLTPTEPASLVGASNSPADVPSEGRGELLPFNLADALAGKPVVTRDGRRVNKLKVGEVMIDVWTANAAFTVWKDGNYHTVGEHPLDLFMLPTEGSVA